MQIKIDTKEKFHIITLQVDPAAVTLTAEMVLSLQEQLHYSVKNVILNMSAVQDIELNVAEQLVAVQQTFYEQNASFVICALSKKVEELSLIHIFLEMHISHLVAKQGFGL